MYMISLVGRQKYHIFKSFRLKKMGLNTYMYAPKDDCKHRAFWRDLYSVEEAGKTHPKSKKYTSRCFLPNNADFRFYSFRVEICNIYNLILFTLKSAR
jgi:hypothetical protein